MPDDTFPRLERGVSDRDYFAMNDFVSRSYLAAVAKGGGETQRWLDAGHSIFTGNQGTKTGTKFDKLIEHIIHGGSFEDKIAVAPPEVLTNNGHRRGKAYEQWRNEVSNEGKIECSSDEEFQLSHMLEHLMECAPARELIEATDETQLTGLFEWEGVLCRVRPDGVTPNQWWDLKTTASDWTQLSKSCMNFGYSEQQAMYSECARQLGWPEFKFPFVFVQTFPPYRCRVFYIPDDIVEHARARLINTIHEVRLRQRTGIYLPIEIDSIEEIEFPRYHIVEEEVFDG